MPYKKGAGNKPQDYDPRTGEYTSLPSANDIISKAEKGVGRITRLSKREYAILRAEIFRKQSQRGYSKRIDCAFTAEYFYIYENGSGIGAFTVKNKFLIEGNEDIISGYIRRLDAHGQNE